MAVVMFLLWGLGSSSKIIQIVGRIVIWGYTTKVPVYLLVIGWDSSQLLEAACSFFFFFLQFLLKQPPQAVQNMDAYFLPGQEKHIPLIPTILPLQVGYDGGSYNMVKPQAPSTLKGRALYQVCTPKNLGGHLRILPTTQCCAVLCSA